METWSVKAMETAGLYYDFVQDNQSFSAQKHTLRGIHLQRGAASQAKLVRCTRGAVLDVAVDLRKGSPTYLQWVAEELSEENGHQLLIPRGMGHAFLTLTEDAEFCYKVDNDYAPAEERSILWNDGQLGIDWGDVSPILSEKDAAAPLYRDSDIDFNYEEKA